MPGIHRAKHEAHFQRLLTSPVGREPWLSALGSSEEIPTPRSSWPEHERLAGVLQRCRIYVSCHETNFPVSFLKRYTVEVKSPLGT